MREELRRVTRVERPHARPADRRRRRLRPRRRASSSTTPPSARSGTCRADWLAAAPGRERHPRPAPRRAKAARAGRTTATGARDTSPPIAAPQPREELWHLPDGRTLRMVAMPNADGGMTYIYENVTEQMTLESRLKALLAAAGRDARPSDRGGGGVRHRRPAAPLQPGLRRYLAAVAGPPARRSRTSARSSPTARRSIPTRRPGTTIRTAVTDLDHDDQAVGRMERPDGSVIDFATVALPEGMTMLTFVDVTDSARIQRVLKERNEALEAADRLKSDFIQHVSYELRSPLTTIIGFSELLAERDGRQAQPAAARIHGPHRCRRRARCSPSSTTSSTSRPSTPASCRSTSARRTSRRSSRRGRGAARPAGRAADRRWKSPIPKDIGTFHVDEQRVRQILFNLVSNAIRFSNAGGRIRVEAAREGQLGRLHGQRRRRRHPARRAAERSSSPSRRMPRRAGAAAPGSACRSSRASSSCMAARSRSAPRRARARRRSCACRSLPAAAAVAAE